MTLQRPSPTFSALTLSVMEVNASRLVRISKHDSGEPYFGRSGANRFDDPRMLLPALDRYGTSYFGFALACAFAETVLHEKTAVDGAFKLKWSALDRWVVRFKSAKLNLAVMTGKELKSLGGEGSLSTIMPYDLPQAWSLAIYEHPATVDGFIYISRHVNTEEAVVLFERAKPKLTPKKAKYEHFLDYKGSARVLKEFHVQPY